MAALYEDPKTSSFVAISSRRRISACCADHFAWDAQAIKLLLILGTRFGAVVGDEDQSFSTVAQHPYCLCSAREDVLARPQNACPS